MLSLLHLATGSGGPVYIYLVESPSGGLLRCLIPLGVALLHCWRSKPTLFSSLHPPSEQTSLTRVVLLLWVRFYSRLISLWDVRYTPPSGGRLLSGFGGSVCSLLGGLHRTLYATIKITWERSCLTVIEDRMNTDVSSGHWKVTIFNAFNY